MTNGQTGQGNRSPLSSASKKNNKKNPGKKVTETSGQIDKQIPPDFEHKSSDNELSINLPDVSIKDDSIQSIKDLKDAIGKQNKQILQMKAEFDGKIDALYNVIRIKDETIGKLQQEMGEVKSSCDFLSEETTEIRGQIKSNEAILNSHAKKHDEVVSKTVDWEDHSRRNNLLFFNIPEVTDENNTRENCEEKITNLLEEKEFFDRDPIMKYT